MKRAIAPSLILVGLFAAGSVVAADSPYASWQSSDDDKVKIDDSFNKRFEKNVSYDNDVATHHEANRYTDIDVNKSSDDDYTRTTDIDVTKSSDDDYTRTTDIDITKSSDDDYTHTTDITKSWQQSTDVDFQIATPTLTSYKYQDQDAGHQADTQVLGAARGHEVAVQGGPTIVSAGNDEQKFYGPAMVNTNVNQLPQNNLFVQGSNLAPVSQSNTFAGRDMGPKGVFAPIGNTSAAVMGDVAQQSAAQVGQSGDSSNRVADPMNADISK